MLGSYPAPAIQKIILNFEVRGLAGLVAVESFPIIMRDANVPARSEPAISINRWNGWSGSSRPVSRVLCPLEADGNHLSSPAVTGRFMQPTRGLGRASFSVPLFGLALDGVFTAGTVTRPPVSSYLTISPLPASA